MSPWGKRAERHGGLSYTAFLATSSESQIFKKKNKDLKIKFVLENKYWLKLSIGISFLRLS